MFLSRIVLNPASTAVRRDTGDCYALHRTIMRAIGHVETGGGKGPRATAGVLHRLELDRKRGVYVLFVQSETRPDWSVLPANYAMPRLPGLPGVSITDLGSSPDWIREGALLRFRLKANPTKKTGTTRRDDRLAGKAKNNGKRVPLVGRAARLAWLASRAKISGFEIVRVVDTAPAQMDWDDERGVAAVVDYSFLTTRGFRKGSTITFKGVTFDGILRVTDLVTFMTAMRTGIGPGKSFGFGLLSVAPVR
ncbi:MAG: type I-E CRISPR-associated protein Cas6/Cse3/CasE [Candidatus Sigynarchaeota archaeon]